MALSNDGERLYVAEHESGRILVYEVQWAGYTCSNQFLINCNSMELFDSSRKLVDASSLNLDPSVTYRFDVSEDMTVFFWYRFALSTLNVISNDHPSVVS